MIKLSEKKSRPHSVRHGEVTELKEGSRSLTEERKQRRERFTKLKRTSLDTVISQSSENGSAFEQLSKLKFDEGNFIGAIHDALSAVERGQRKASVFATLGCCLYEIGKFDDSVQSFRKALAAAFIQKVSFEFEVCTYMARAFMKDSAFADAYKACAEGLFDGHRRASSFDFCGKGRFGGLGAFHIFAATLQSETGDYNGALDHYEKAHREPEKSLYPFTSVEVWYLVAKLYAVMGEFECEMEAQAQAPQFDKSQPWATLAEKHMQQDNFTAAVECLDEAIMREPWNTRYLQSLVNCIEKGRIRDRTEEVSKLKDLITNWSKDLDEFSSVTKDNQSISKSAGNQKGSDCSSSEDEEEPVENPIHEAKKYIYRKTRFEKRIKRERAELAAARQKPQMLPQDSKKADEMKAEDEETVEFTRFSSTRMMSQRERSKSSMFGLRPINKAFIAGKRSLNRTTTHQMRQRLATHLNQVDNSPFRRNQRLQNPYEDGRLDISLRKQSSFKETPSISSGKIFESTNKQDGHQGTLEENQVEGPDQVKGEEVKEVKNGEKVESPKDSARSQSRITSQRITIEGKDNSKHDIHEIKKPHSTLVGETTTEDGDIESSKKEKINIENDLKESIRDQRETSEEISIGGIQNQQEESFTRKENSESGREGETGDTSDNIQETGDKSDNIQELIKKYSHIGFEKPPEQKTQIDARNQQEQNDESEVDIDELVSKYTSRSTVLAEASTEVSNKEANHLDIIGGEVEAQSSSLIDLQALMTDDDEFDDGDFQQAKDKPLFSIETSDQLQQIANKEEKYGDNKYEEEKQVDNSEYVGTIENTMKSLLPSHSTQNNSIPSEDESKAEVSGFSSSLKSSDPSAEVVEASVESRHDFDSEAFTQSVVNTARSNVLFGRSRSQETEKGDLLNKTPSEKVSAYLEAARRETVVPSMPLLIPEKSDALHFIDEADGSSEDEETIDQFVADLEIYPSTLSVTESPLVAARRETVVPTMPELDAENIFQSFKLHDSMSDIGEEEDPLAGDFESKALFSESDNEDDVDALFNSISTLVKDRSAGSGLGENSTADIGKVDATSTKIESPEVNSNNEAVSKAEVVFEVRQGNRDFKTEEKDQEGTIRTTEALLKSFGSDLSIDFGTDDEDNELYNSEWKPSE